MPAHDQGNQPFAEVGADEVLRFTGTEPFWNGQVAGGAMEYTTPEHPDGQAIQVQRFAGRAGLSFSGSLDGQSLDMTVTEGACSDGMSDRRYPYTVTLRIGQDLRNGCAWTDKRPAEGPPAP